MREQFLQLLLQAFDARIDEEKGFRADEEHDSADWHYSDGCVDGVDKGRHLVEQVFEEHGHLLDDAHKRNTALTVEINELCQLHGIGKIGESVLPALKHYIEQSREFYQATERLLINEIGDFFAAHGGMLTVQQAQQELITRTQRVFTLVKLQAQHKPLERFCEGITDGFGTRNKCKECAHFKPELAAQCTIKIDPNLCRMRFGTSFFLQFKAKDGGK